MRGEVARGGAPCTPYVPCAPRLSSFRRRRGRRVCRAASPNNLAPPTYGSGAVGFEARLTTLRILPSEPHLESAVDRQPGRLVEPEAQPEAELLGGLALLRDRLARAHRLRDR